MMDRVFGLILIIKVITNPKGVGLIDTYAFNPPAISSNTQLALARDSTVLEHVPFFS